MKTARNLLLIVSIVIVIVAIILQHFPGESVNACSHTPQFDDSGLENVSICL